MTERVCVTVILASVTFERFELQCCKNKAHTRATRSDAISAGKTKQCRFSFSIDFLESNSPFAGLVVSFVKGEVWPKSEQFFFCFFSY